jgi:starch synthase/alpha-amylase
MVDSYHKPRLLVVTPEVAYLPNGMCKVSEVLKAKAGDLAEISASIIRTLFENGANVHVALPDYRRIFNHTEDTIISKELSKLRCRMPFEKIHLAQDRAFFYLNSIYSNNEHENLKIALTFQRDVINNIIPEVRPDIIHCYDWATALIPAMAKQIGIPCLFTVSENRTMKSTLSHIEDIGIDCAQFWENCFYEYMPLGYTETRESNQIDFLATGIFASRYANTTNQALLNQMIDEKHNSINHLPHRAIVKKLRSGLTIGIDHAPDPSFNPAVDESLLYRYNSDNHSSAKKRNKLFLQETLGLTMDSNAPILFWPCPAINNQKEFSLLVEILNEVFTKYRKQNLQIVILSNGEFKNYLKDIIEAQDLGCRGTALEYDEKLCRSAYAGSDFLLIPSSPERNRIQLMTGLLYGTLPITYGKEKAHVPIVNMDVKNNIGNGFLFKNLDGNGLKWAIDQAMSFYKISDKMKKKHIQRIMMHAVNEYNYTNTINNYLSLFEKMLNRPLFN